MTVFLFGNVGRFSIMPPKDPREPDQHAGSTCAAVRRRRCLSRHYFFFA